jgi:hypothetical protein
VTNPDYPDAKQMARDLLLNSKRFIIDLLNFMSQDYNSWKLRGYTKKKAWRMTCRSVHHILDDLQGARITRRDAGDGYELDWMRATYKWATATQRVSFNHLGILNGKKYKPFSYVFLPFSIYETV